MINVIRLWFQRYFSDPEAILLAILLVFGFVVVLFWGKLLAPLIASIIIAYCLQWLVRSLTKFHVPRLLAIVTIYMVFLSLFFGLLFIVWPSVWKQMINLVEELPNMLNQTQKLLYLLPEKFPQYVSYEMIDGFTLGVIKQLRDFGRTLLAATLTYIPNLIVLVVYLFLVPLMIFFFLKDHLKIIHWFTNFLPTQRVLLKHVWEEVDFQIGNYIRGKIAEVLLVTFFTFLVFIWFKMPYATLLSILVGISVFVPYVGAVVVTIPVFLVAFFEWGFNPTFFWITTLYIVVQILDGFLLVPLLFAEAVNLHPIAIIMAILIFGSVWGFWGVFFAIPLATLVKAVLDAWPRNQNYIPTTAAP